MIHSTISPVIMDMCEGDCLCNLQFLKFHRVTKNTSFNYWAAANPPVDVEVLRPISSHFCLICGNRRYRTKQEHLDLLLSH